MTIEVILGVLVLLVAALAFSDYTRRKTRTPHLVYLVLPPYEVPGMIVVGGVLVENRGTASANGIRIALAYPDERAQRIRYLQIFSDAEYAQESGGESESFVRLKVNELNPGQKVIVYFSGMDRMLPRVRVTQGVMSD